MKNKQPKKAALYCRLSVDDGRMGESVSIGSQKLLLEQYCKDHAIDNYEVYDDAFTTDRIQTNKRSTAEKYAKLRHFR